MIMRNLTAAAAAIVAMTKTASARAKTVVYTVTGSVDGSIDGTALAGQRLTLHRVGDTDAAQDIFDEIHQPLNEHVLSARREPLSAGCASGFEDSRLHQPCDIEIADSREL